MIKVNLPGGRTINVDASSPEEAAVAAKKFLDNEARQAALDNLGRGTAAELGVDPNAPEPELPGNAVSRFVGGLKNDQSVPGPLGAAIRGASHIAEAVAEDPVAAIVDPLAAPTRILPASGRISQSVLDGKPLEALGNLAELGTAIGETGLILAPGAGQALSRARPSTLTSPQRKAAERLLEADPDVLKKASQARRLEASGQPVTTADLLSRQGQSRLKGAARRDGPAQDIAQDALDPRAAAQVERVGDEIRTAFSVQDDFLTTFDNIADARSAQAGPLYKQAYETPTPITPALKELMERPPLQKAIKEAEELAAIDGVFLRKTSGIPSDTATLHYMRKALDEQIDTFRDGTTGRLKLTPRAKALVGLRKKYNDALRQANPAFEQADSIWSDGSAALQAMEQGVKAAGLTTERQLRQRMRAAVNDGNSEFFRLGFAQGLTERVGKSGSDFANQTLKLLSPENQRKIKAVLGDDRGEAFLNRMRVENLMSRTRNRISPNVGSDTAENAQQTASLAISLVSDLARGNARGALASSIRTVGGKKLSDKLLKAQQEVDEALVRMATEDPDELIRIISEIAQKEASSAVSPRVVVDPALRGSAITLAEQLRQGIQPPQ